MECGFNWDKVSKDNRVIDLLKKIQGIEKEIMSLDANALISYEIEKLKN